VAIGPRFTQYHAMRSTEESEYPRTTEPAPPARRDRFGAFGSERRAGGAEPGEAHVLAQQLHRLVQRRRDGLAADRHAHRTERLAGLEAHAVHERGLEGLLDGPGGPLDAFERGDRGVEDGGGIALEGL